MTRLRELVRLWNIYAAESQELAVSPRPRIVRYEAKAHGTVQLHFADRRCVLILVGELRTVLAAFKGQVDERAESIPGHHWTPVTLPPEEEP